MRMARMWNAHVLLFRIHIPEWTKCHSIHSAPRGRMNRMLRPKSKMADGEISATDSNAPLPGLPEKQSGYTFGHNETLLLISLYQTCEAFFSDVSFGKKVIWQMIARNMNKSGYFPSATNCENGWKFFTSSFRKCEDNNSKGGRQICYAMSTLTRPRIATGVFFMQAIRIIPSIPYQPFLFQNCE